MAGQSFSAFMAKALYDPIHGYYMSSQEKIGPQGDFITAPQSSPFLSTALALAYQQCAEFTRTPLPIVEIGAGRGDMAQHVLTTLKEQNLLPPAYYLIDISPDMQQKQRALLKTHHPDYYSRCVFAHHITDIPEQAFVIANELLDAIPVDRFQKIASDTYQMLGVTCSESPQWVGMPCQQAQHLAIAKRERSISPDSWPIGYHSELHDYQAIIHTLSQRIQRGVIYWIDYGYDEKEYFHPQRTTGTLTCFYQHQSSDNPFEHVGKQDLSAHVDFTALSDALKSEQWQQQGYCTQEAFLLSQSFWPHLTQLLTNHPSLAGAFNQLVAPYEMGQTMKVMQCTKGFNRMPAVGFDRQNKINILA